MPRTAVQIEIAFGAGIRVDFGIGLE